MNKLFARVLAFFRGPMHAPPALEEKAQGGLSAERLDEALERLRAQSPPGEDELAADDEPGEAEPAQEQPPDAE